MNYSNTSGFFAKNRASQSAASCRRPAHYEAFISYRHLDLDIFAAEHLHKELEHYVIPRSARKQPDQKHIEHIFRDRDELPVSSDLSETITQALHNSHYLIVICTPETSKSGWVSKEIETFLQTHSRDNIILVLADGEPEESFPEQVLYYPDPNCPGRYLEKEPLAADIRGRTPKERLKKIKEEKLRIMAALLSVPYDRLVQRDRDYKIRRLILSGSIVGACLLSFGIYTSLQNHRIQNLYNETNLALAKETAASAQEIYESGDRKGAIEKLMSVRAKNGSLLSAEQLFPLSMMMNENKTGFTLDFYPESQIPLGSTGMSQAPAVDPSYRYAAWMDTQSFTIYDMEEDHIIWNPSAADLGFSDERDVHALSKAGSGILLKDEKTAIVWNDNYFHIIDYQNKKVGSAIFPYPEENYGVSIIWAELDSSGSNLYLAGKTAEHSFLKLYALSEPSSLDAKQIFSTDFNGLLLSDQQGFALNKETGNVAVTAYTVYDSSEKTENGLYLVNPSAGQTSVEKLSEQAFCASLWTGPDTLAAIAPMKDIAFENSETYLNNQYQLTTWNSGKIVRQSGPWSLSSSQRDHPAEVVEREGKTQIVLASDSRIYLLDPQTHETLWQGGFGREINQIFTIGEENRIRALTGNEAVNIISLNSAEGDIPLFVQIMKTSQYIESIRPFYNQNRMLSGFGTIGFRSKDNSFSGQYTFTDYRSFDRDEAEYTTFPNLQAVEWDMKDAGSPLALLIGSEAADSASTQKLTDFDVSLFDCASTESILDIKCSIDTNLYSETWQSGNLKWDEYDGYLYPGFTLINEAESPVVVWTDGKNFYRQKPGESSPSAAGDLDLKNPRAAVFSPSGKYAAISSTGGIQLYQWSPADGRYLLQQSPETELYIDEFGWSSDERFLACASYNKLQVFDLQKNSWIQLEGQSEPVIETGGYSTFPIQLKTTGSSVFKFGKNKPYLLLSQTSDPEDSVRSPKVLKVYDLSTGKELLQVTEEMIGGTPSSSFVPSSADFSGQDQELVVTANMKNQSGGPVYSRFRIRDEKKLYTQVLAGSLGKIMITDHPVSSADGKLLYLNGSGGWMLNKDDGYTTWGPSLYQIDHGSPVPITAFNAGKVFISPDFSWCIQTGSSAVLIQRITSEPELIEKAEAYLKERQDLENQMLKTSENAD